MNVAAPRPARTACRFGSVTVLSVPTVVERPTPSVLSLSWFSLLHEELQEVDRLGRRVLADGDAVAAADAVGRGAGATGHGREREPAELVAKTLLADALVLLDRRRPLAHQLHGGLAVADRGRLAVVVRAGVALLVRIEGVERQDRLAGLDAGVGVPVAGLDHLAERVAAAVAEHAGTSRGASTATCPCPRWRAGRRRPP